MTETGSAPEPHAHPVSRLRTLWLMLVTIVAPVLILDQASKFYVASHLRLYQEIPIVPHLLGLAYTLNSGAAFSLFANLPAEFRIGFLFTITGIAIVVLTILLAQAHEPSWQTVGFALILAGALGNLIDRILRGRVIDFIHVHYYDWNYPIFNLADSAITIGVAILLIEGLGRSDRPRVG
ncbi:MAG TPA: signal peptidase II [Candidatus Binataceae bacterium]|jgi:signal peptidase II|nr:signal peptidase II [Candidatus Binataceae bacterium]